MNSTIAGERIRDLTATAVMTAVMCVLGPIAVPIGPVPISLTNLAIYMSLYLLGLKRGGLSCLLYITLGAAGMPVFSGAAGGMAKILGPTGGYIIGFLPMALIAGAAIERTHRRAVHIAAMIAGTLVCYAAGTAWFSVVTGMDLASTLALCVWPFVPGDLLKIIVSSHFGPIIRARLYRTR